MKKTWVGIVIFFFIIIATTLFSQERYGAFMRRSFGCKSVNDTAILAQLKDIQKEQFVHTLKDYCSTGKCRRFRRGNGFAFCTDISRVIGGNNLIRIKAFSDDKEYWVEQRDTTPVRMLYDAEK